MTGVLRSGWWVLLLAAALTVGTAVFLAVSSRPPGTSRLGDGRDPSTYGFDLSVLAVDRDRVVASGMPRDGLIALDHPPMLDAAEVIRSVEEEHSKLLLPSDRVIGVAIAGDARAYPLRLMRWHEVVNDTVAGFPLAITYHPLCDSVVIWSRQVQGETLSFGVSGLLLSSNLLLYDRRPTPAASSLWRQLDGRAVAGPAAGEGRRLHLLPMALTTWSQWLERHPDTTVLAPDPRLGDAYRNDPYHSYFGSDLLRFPVAPLPPPGDLHLKDRVVVVGEDGFEKTFALPRLAAAAGLQAGCWLGAVGDIPVRIDFSLDPPTAAVSTIDSGDPPLPSRFACYFAWYAAAPAARDEGPLPVLPEPM